MVKTLKKLAALTAAVALVCSFAVCASAVTVTTTTTYAGQTGDKVSVTAVVTAEGTELNGAQVTYYATNAAATATDTVVYLDQKPAADGSATFTYETNAAYLLNSTAKVGYTAGTAVDAPLSGIAVKLDGVLQTVIPYATLNGTHTVRYTPTAGKIVTGVTASNGTAEFVDADATSFTFILTDASAGVEISVIEETPAVEIEATITPINAGGIVAGADSNDAVEGGELADSAKAEEGNRKLTVIGKVTGEAQGAEFGIIVADAIDADATELPAGAFKALEKNAAGYFAVQLIDSSDDATSEFIKSGEEYETAIYVKVGDTCKIIKGVNVTIAAE